MATIPVYSPVVPFLGLIPGGIQQGSMIRVKGVINAHGERCQINVQTGAALSPRDDVTLHLSIRPQEHAIVRNTLQNQVWGAEERYGGCPIRYGQPFDLLILAEVNQYKIAINGNHFCTFHHRLPLHNARYVSVSGTCVVHSITTERDTGAPPAGHVPTPYPGAVPVLPPPYTPPTGGNIGFVPVPPPMPPPPPYTPTPGYPIGGHYPGGPSQPGYPHHPGYPHPGATPYSPSPSATSGPKPLYPSLGSIGAASKSLKDSIATGIDQSKKFIQDAVFGQTTPQHVQHPTAYNNQFPVNPPPSNIPQQFPIGGQYPLMPSHQATAPPEHLASGVGLAAPAGATTAVLPKMPMRDVRKEKNAKFGRS